MNSGPQLIFWEITQSCNLRCPYCRRQDFYENSSTQEASLSLIDNITRDYKPLLIFSGGEPLLYPYIFEVAAYARQRGLNTALATNATLIDRNLAKKIQSLNLHRVAVSLDGATEATHDFLRGEGSFLKALAGIRHLKSQGIELQINATVMRRNFKEIFQIHNLCLDLKIDYLHIFAFVPVGCGITLPHQERLSAGEYEDFLNEVADLSLKSKVRIKLTCAPHYNRVILKKRKDSMVGKGCLAGSSVCFISNTGEVFPCGYLAISAGNIFNQSFREIWEESSLFGVLRNFNFLKGKCHKCEYISVCGGCRARAWADTGDYLEEEPDCAYQPLSVRS